MSFIPLLEENNVYQRDKRQNPENQERFHKTEPGFGLRPNHCPGNIRYKHRYGSKEISSYLIFPEQRKQGDEDKNHGSQATDDDTHTVAVE
ncbi:MAG: hypothetical protein PHR36_02675 [Patescibacteria group bacterium]|nr:hypothetical protein [Patescibacteria group bacterium]